MATIVACSSKNGNSPPGKLKVNYVVARIYEADTMDRYNDYANLNSCLMKGEQNEMEYRYGYKL